jgi:hypothetical protein
MRASPGPTRASLKDLIFKNQSTRTGAMMFRTRSIGRSACTCDEDITPMDIQEVPPLDIQTIQGPITRARARQLNLEVSSLLGVSINNCENSLLPNFYNMIRNQGEVQGTYREEHRGVEEQQGPPSHMESQSNLTSSPPRSPGAA